MNFRSRHGSLNIITADIRGVTLIEAVIAISLTALLLVLVNGMTSGLARVTVRVREASVAARRLEFCVELMRRELAESRFGTSGNASGTATGTAFVPRGGDGMLSYPTGRGEVIAHDEMPRGFLRVDWHFDPSTGTLSRVVTPIEGWGNEAGSMRETVLLSGVKELVFSIYTEGKWFPLTGTLAPFEKAEAIRLDIGFIPGESPLFHNAFSTAFSLPR
ncbi:MAG: hypothetical protein HQM09_01815 [Candidatus Riflebacteria bacterium]|nr:hypothetical protein [Candidatus Riflebacteria bacterium]